MGLDEPETTFTMECLDNYFEATMSADAACIGVNLYIQNAFAWEIDSDKHSRQFYQLRDYAVEHPEGGKILRFID